MEHLVGILDSLPHALVLASPTAVLWWVFAALPHPFAITLIVCGFGLLMKVGDIRLAWYSALLLQGV